MNWTRTEFSGLRRRSLCWRRIEGEKGCVRRPNSSLIGRRGSGCVMVGLLREPRDQDPNYRQAAFYRRPLHQQLCLHSGQFRELCDVTDGAPSAPARHCRFLTSTPSRNPERGSPAAPASFANEVLLSDCFRRPATTAAMWAGGISERRASGHVFPRPSPAAGTLPASTRHSWSTASRPRRAVRRRSPDRHATHSSTARTGPFCSWVSYPAAPARRRAPSKYSISTKPPGSRRSASNPLHPRRWKARRCWPIRPIDPQGRRRDLAARRPGRRFAEGDHPEGHLRKHGARLHECHRQFLGRRGLWVRATPPSAKSL